MVKRKTININSLNLSIIEQVLTAKEIFVLDKRLGLNGEKMTSKDVGLKLKLSRSRVNQIELTALEKISIDGNKTLKEIYDNKYLTVNNKLRQIAAFKESESRISENNGKIREIQSKKELDEDIKRMYGKLGK